MKVCRMAGFRFGGVIREVEEGMQVARRAAEEVGGVVEMDGIMVMGSRWEMGVSRRGIWAVGVQRMRGRIRRRCLGIRD